MEICLIVPAFPGMVASIHPPLGLIVFRSMLKTLAGLDAAIIDGFPVTEEGSCSLATEFCVVGIQIHSLNVEPAIRLGRFLRQQGCRVFIGGPEVTLSKDLTWADGAYDIAIRNHACETSVSAIKNLLQSGSPGSPIILSGSLYPVHRIDYSGLDLSVYWNRAMSAGRPLKHAPVMTHLGCSYRDLSKGGCTFCADVQQPFSVRSSRDLNAEIDQLHQLYGVQAFDCVGENLTRKLSDLLMTTVIPPQNSVWSFFSRASELETKTVEKMRSFGIREVRLGGESGDSEILATTTKGETVDGIERAIQILASTGIRVVVSFILGLPGESKLSLQRTQETAFRWAEKYHNLSISSSVIMPIPGSSIAKMAGVLPGKGINEADQRDFVARFTSVTWGDIETAGYALSQLPTAEKPAVTRVMAPWRPQADRQQILEAVRCA